MFDQCETCGHFRNSHMNPFTNRAEYCHRCKLRPDSTPEPGEKWDGPRVEDRGIACKAFKEKLEEPHV